MATQPPDKAAPRQERRRYGRYNIRAQAWVEWQTEEGERRVCAGEALNVGLGGLFIAGHAFPPAGSQVRLMVRIRLQWERDNQIVLRGNGEVRHVSGSSAVDGGFGVCAMYELEFPHPKNETLSCGPHGVN